MTAYLASREGRRVVVVDRGMIGDGETARTTAHLTCILDRRYYELEDLHGRGGARLAARSHVAAMARMEAIIRKEGIRCGFERVSAYLFEPRGAPTGELEREFAAARRAGVRNLKWSTRVPLKGFDTGRCLHLPNQAQLHPLRLLHGLVTAIRRNGGRVVARANASHIESGRPGNVVLEDGPTIEADEIVVATNAPVHSRLAMHARQDPYRTYAIGVDVPRGSVKRMLCYDTVKPYHYVRLERGLGPLQAADLLIVGGEDHPTGGSDDAEKRWRALERWTRARFPMSGRIAYRWSGQVFEPHDGLACIGRDRGTSHLSIITGGSGSGMTYGMIGAMILTDLWSGRKNPWAELYDPARTIRKGMRETRASADEPGAAADAEQAAPRSAATIRRGEGAILRRSGHAYATYRDHAGTLHRHSAKCTHLGCPVIWNSAEKTWDCVCHGSRFDARGGAVCGPAIEDLRAIARHRRGR